MFDIRGFTYGFALGVGSMFFWDPDRGAARRARVRDGSRRAARELQEFVQLGRRDLENRARGAGAHARSVVRPEVGELSEDRLVARVRSRLGHVTPHAHAIEVRWKEGDEIELKGPALASEHDRIVRATSHVRGVRAVDDDLVVYAEADGIPGLEGRLSDRYRAEGPLAPGPRLLVAASIAALLASPVAPVFTKSLINAATRSILRSPSVRRDRPARSRPRARPAEPRESRL